MAKVQADPCPRCERPVEILPAAGGLGCGDYTTYGFRCLCGLEHDHFGGDGTHISGVRHYNRWAREQKGLPVRASRGRKRRALAGNPAAAGALRYAEEAVKGAATLLANLRCLGTMASPDMTAVVERCIEDVQRAEADIAAFLPALRAAADEGRARP